jgi:hypothetical protein
MTSEGRTTGGLQDAWQPLLQGRLPDAATLHQWQTQLLAGQAQTLDGTLAELWRQCRPVVRTQALREMLAGARLGPELVHALLGSLDTADPDSGNAALHVLGDAREIPLDASGWRRVARVARRERGQVVPDREATQLLARQGPPSSLPTVLLTAFRPGPEDADDRLGALAGLGRFDDARVPELLARVMKSGAAVLEGLQSAAVAIARGAEPEAWLPVLQEAAKTRIDAWARWTALDGLTRIVPPAQTLPWLIAALRAGGADLPEWYLPFCAGRAQALAPGVDVAAWPGEVPALEPLPALAGRVLSRCPRVARAAMVEWQQSHGPDDALIQQRAGLEVALVQRGQLLGSFVAGVQTQPSALDGTWRPWAQALEPHERKELQDAEAAWLQTPD